MNATWRFPPGADFAFMRCSSDRVLFCSYVDTTPLLRVIAAHCSRADKMDFNVYLPVMGNQFFIFLFFTVSSSYKSFMEENTFSEAFGIHRSTLSERPLSDLFSLWVGLGYWREKASVDLQLCGWKCLVGVRGQRSEWTGLGGDHRKAAETRVTSGCTQRRQSSVSERTTPPTLKQFRRSSHFSG